MSTVGLPSNSNSNLAALQFQQQQQQQAALGGSSMAMSLANNVGRINIRALFVNNKGERLDQCVVPLDSPEFTVRQWCREALKRFSNRHHDTAAQSDFPVKDVLVGDFGTYYGDKLLGVMNPACDNVTICLDTDCSSDDIRKKTVAHLYRPNVNPNNASKNNSNNNSGGDEGPAAAPKTPLDYFNAAKLNNSSSGRSALASTGAAAAGAKTGPHDSAAAAAGKCAKNSNKNSKKGGKHAAVATAEQQPQPQQQQQQQERRQTAGNHHNNAKQQHQQHQHQQPMGKVSKQLFSTPVRQVKSSDDITEQLLDPTTDLFEEGDEKRKAKNEPRAAKMRRGEGKTEEEEEEEIPGIYTIKPGNTTTSGTSVAGVSPPSDTDHLEDLLDHLEEVGAKKRERNDSLLASKQLPTTQQRRPNRDRDDDSDSHQRGHAESKQSRNASLRGYGTTAVKNLPSNFCSDPDKLARILRKQKKSENTILMDIHAQSHASPTASSAAEQDPLPRGWGAESLKFLDPLTYASNPDQLTPGRRAAILNHTLPPRQRRPVPNLDQLI